MAPQEAQQAYDEIVAHINKQGGAYRTWYCGITSDYDRRLFVEHNVPRGEDYWYIARRCNNNAAARAVEEALLKLGCDGGLGGGDQTAVFVYAYLKGSMTIP